ncbi:hypothetical protein WJX84_011594 [Apatococcus fuscideae]|uniref:UBA domain-containing protein n=1 Tax=Apatococcus fuscideae TaxID=2026836 RepID=A0AAW1T4F1_9CHLO
MNPQRLGTTEKGNLVDLDLREKLCKIGYSPELAAEALRLTENGADRALDMLSNPDASDALQLGLMERQERREERRKRARLARAEQHGDMQSHQQVNAAGVASGATSAEPASAAAATAGPSEVAEMDPLDDQEDFQEESLDPDDLVPETRDVEAEDELIQGVSRDPLAAYDVHVSEEGQAIQEYLDKIASMQGICDA